MTRTVLVTIAVAASLFVAGCGSKDSEADPTTAVATSSAAADVSPVAEEAKPARSEVPEEPGYTLNEYLSDNGITRNFIAPGAPDVLQPVLPVPDGWTDVGGSRPDGSWGMLALTATMEAPDPTMILVGWAKLEGPVDPVKVLELAPVSVTQFAEFDGPETGERSRVSGFDAVEIAGTFVDDEGKPAYTTQKWVVIPADGGAYELFIMAKGPPDQEAAMNEAMSAISSGTTIPAS